MKYLLIFLLLLSISCKNDNVIQAKSHFTFNNDPLPNGLCRFWVNNNEFNDSCKFYYVGDTVGKIKRKN